MEPQSLEDKTPTYYIPIPGTHAWDEDPNEYEWYELGSNFNLYLEENHNIFVYPRGHLPWSTSIDGILGKRDLAVWKSAALHLECHLENVALKHRNIIAHSHGGQIALIAAANGVRIRNLITVGTPIRKDIEKFAEIAAGNIDYWFHICDSKTDITSVLGALFDGRIRIKHTFDQANDFADINGIGHSKILNECWAIKMWGYKGWAKRLRYGANHVNR